MSVASHLDELRRKHAALENRIENELQHPGSDDLEISALKREKLKLKDEINRLGGETVH